MIANYTFLFSQRRPNQVIIKANGGGRGGGIGGRECSLNKGMPDKTSVGTMDGGGVKYVLHCSGYVSHITLYFA